MAKISLITFYYHIDNGGAGGAGSQGDEIMSFQGTLAN